VFGLSISFALKGLHILAQGKQTRVLRVFVSPWVEETPDSRPSKQRWFGRRVTEAETGRGFIAASATCRTKADVTARPPPRVLIEPRAAAMLVDQPAVSARRITSATFHRRSTLRDGAELLYACWRGERD